MPPFAALTRYSPDRLQASATVAILLTFATWTLAFGQASSRPCPPPPDRVTAPGTCLTARTDLGKLPRRPMYWHLDRFPTLADAEGARSTRGTVVESLGRIWLFTIADSAWRPARGTRIAEIGPLPGLDTVAYTAVYMQSIFQPGMSAPVHIHSGPEAFYTLTGGTCLETPAGVIVGSPDGHVLIVPGGPPMALTATGTTERRGVVLILHESAEPATTMVHDWMPKGLCSQ